VDTGGPSYRDTEQFLGFPAHWKESRDSSFSVLVLVSAFHLLDPIKYESTSSSRWLLLRGVIYRSFIGPRRQKLYSIQAWKDAELSGSLRT